MKSSLKNMVLVLFCITLLSSAGVGAVYMITEAPIAAAKATAEKKALAAVLPEFDKVEEIKLDTVKMQEPIEALAYKATKGGKVVGYAIKSTTKKGFSGTIRMMVGFDTEGKIINVNVLEQGETPGLGANITKEDNPVLASIKVQNKKKPISDIKLQVKKDGGDIDAITAATISSRAYLDAVSTAFSVFKYLVGWSKTIDATGGATNIKKE